MTDYAKLATRLWAKVDSSDPDGCWPWLGSTAGEGYGRLRVDGRPRPVAQLVWEVAHEQPFPVGLYACHTCDNPTCARPDHIFAGTPSENVRDAVAKGRWVRRRTHCKRGHPFVEGSFYVSGPRRTCRQCEATQYEDTAQRLHDAGDFQAADDIRTLVDGLKQHERDLLACDQERQELLRQSPAGVQHFRRRAINAEALAQRYRDALEPLFNLAAVSFEGDHWYAENAGIDGEAVLATARDALAAGDKP